MTLHTLWSCDLRLKSENFILEKGINDGISSAEELATSLKSAQI